MGDLFIYILKSSLCLAAFYLFYKLMLSKETFHKFNRIVLLSLFMLSLIIPFIEITLHKATPYTGLTLNLETLLAMAQNSDVATDSLPDSNKWLEYLLVIYLSGLIASAIKALFSFVRMFSFIRSANAERKNLENNIVLVIHKRAIAPFSWMKYIVVSENDYQESGMEIITHEVAHIAKYHSTDLLLAEVVKILHWFNPAAYLLKQELQNIHEYQADEAVINKGIDAKQYQLLLIKKAVGDRLYTIANSFNHSKLKNRITMISKKKSPKWAALKVMFVLPLSMFAVAVFATEEASTALAPISEVKVTDFLQSDTIKEKAVKTIVVRSNSTSIDIDTAKAGKTFKVRYSSTATYPGDSIKYLDVHIARDPIIFIDDKEVTKDVMNTLDPSKIKYAIVHKGDNALDKYGPRAKNGVIVITTKEAFEKSENSEKSEVFSVIKDEKEGSVVYELKERNPEAGVKERTSYFKFKSKDGIPNNVLYVIDGKIWEYINLVEINPNDIVTIDVIKGDAATKKYGEKGKNGVVEINLKK